MQIEELEMEELSPSPVEYEFLEPDSESPVPSPRHSPIPEKKKEKKKEKESNCFKTVPLYIIIFLLLSGYVYMAIGPTRKYVDKVDKVDKVLYPLYLEQHDTTSVNYQQEFVVMKRIESQLKAHLIQNLDYAVLCMHHLKLPIPYFKLCVLFNSARNEFITMLNPKIVGGSSSKTTYNEHSVSCGKDSFVSTERISRVMVEWEEPDKQTLYSLFDASMSVMLQIAIDEQNGEIKC